ncbi:MAG: LCP family protein [Actinomycetaceae bacterium]|nr:LCP family protein [Actinomycetaceae bacterium]
MSKSRRDATHMRKGQRSRHLGRIATLCVLSLFLTGASALGFAYLRLQGNILQTDVDEYLGSERPADESGKAMNILVLGSDVRTGDSDIDGAGAAGDVDGMRADTTLLVHISADRSRVEAVSIPRDTLVDIPSCEVHDGDDPNNDSKTEMSEPQKNEQFNSAFAIGGSKGHTASAAACTWKTVEKMTDVRIDGYIVVSFAGFKNLVDSLNGVPMYFEEDLEDSASGLNVSAGCQILDGDQALALARARKGLGDGSDIGRIGRQQELITAMFRETSNLNLLTDMSALYRVLNAGTKSIETSQGLGDIPALARLANSLRNLDQIHFVTMPWQAQGARVKMRRGADKLWNALAKDQPVKLTVDEEGRIVDPDAASSAAPSGSGDQGTSDGQGASDSQGASEGQDSAGSDQGSDGSDGHGDGGSETSSAQPASGQQTTKPPACTKSIAKGKG